MKIFIIHASAGSGHQKIAEAIGEDVISLYGKDNARIIDVLDFTPSVFKFFYSIGYIFLISKIKWLWSILFFLADTKYLRLLNYNLRCFNDKIFCKRFLDFIRKEQPDVIISTHFLVNELVSYLKGKNQIKTKLLSIVTDFGVHNFWLAENVDKYIASSFRTREILISKKVDKEKIKVLGIPVRKQFQRQLDKKAAREKLGINTDAFTVLILTGGIGMGPIYDIVKLLIKEVNVIVICGHNQKLYMQLKQLNAPGLVVLGWVDYVEEAMAACDMAITKPGGSTISECLIMDLPMIFFAIIPGQEMQNAQIISENGLGFILKRPKQIEEKILYLKNNPSAVDEIKNNIKSFRMPDSNRNILSLVNEQ